MLRSLICFGLTTLFLATAPAGAAEPITEKEKIDWIYNELRTNLPLRDAKLTLVEADLKDLRRRVEEMERRLRARESSDAPRDIAGAINPPPVLSGDITLHNRATVAATVFLDGTPYRLLPGQAAKISGRPVGPVTYEVVADVWGLIQPATTRALLADRPFTVTINP